MDMCLMLAASVTEPTTLHVIGDWTWRILSVGAGLTFVIFVHELGHFLVAKACGVKCEKFYVGFDFFEIPIPFTRLKIPRSLIKFQWGETEYGLGSLPLGGYVKMLGQDDDPRNAEQEAARTHLPAEAEPGEEAVEARTTEGKPILLDPRSYPAKSIPARMAIISAGVIMNLIFAVIMAAVAYKLGVNETPAIVGGTSPGSPAWEAALEPGSKVVQIRKSGREYEFLRFEDFGAATILNTTERDLPLLVRKPDGQKEWVEIRPVLIKGSPRPILGISLPREAQVKIWREAAGHLNPRTTPELKDRDLIVAAAGQKVAVGMDVPTILAQRPDGPISITVERQPENDKDSSAGDKKQPPQRIDVILHPKPMREIGVTMKIGPVVAIRKGSPAADAGFQEGDIIVALDGEPVGNPLSLSQRFVPRSVPADPVEVTVLRNDAQKKPVKRMLTVVPEPPLQSSTALMTRYASIESMGIAFEVTSQIESVAAGSPAKKADLRPGDKITNVEYIRSEDQARERELNALAYTNLFEARDLTDGTATWADIVSNMQWVYPDTKLKLTWTRGKQTLTAELPTRDSETFFDDTRGIDLYTQRDMHEAQSWGEAFQLGFRETVEQLKQVVMILRSLVTGEISPTNLSGPAGIIAVAGSFASEGLPMLLIFLTILSANLAILNFLPIPALDGGHMLFLTAEAIRGKPVDERLQIRLTIIGVICLLSLMVFATAMDIGRFAQMFQDWFS